VMVANRYAPRCRPLAGLGTLTDLLVLWKVHASHGFGHARGHARLRERHRIDGLEYADAHNLDSAVVRARCADLFICCLLVGAWLMVESWGRDTARTDRGGLCGVGCRCPSHRTPTCRVEPCHRCWPGSGSPGVARYRANPQSHSSQYSRPDLLVSRV
jgi:hypothetical protein